MVVGLEVTIIALAYVCFSVYMQRRLVNPKIVSEMQESIKQKSKELNELSKGHADQNTMLAKQREVTSLLGQSMRMQLKPMFVILPTFFIFFYFVFPAAFPSNPSVTIPILAQSFNYKSYFIIVAFVAGLLVSLALMVRDRMNAAKHKRQETQPAS